MNTPIFTVKRLDNSRDYGIFQDDVIIEAGFGKANAEHYAELYRQQQAEDGCYINGHWHALQA